MEQESEFDKDIDLDKTIREAGSAVEFLKAIGPGGEFCSESALEQPKDLERLKLSIKLLINFARNLEQMKGDQHKFKFNQLRCLQKIKDFLQNCGLGALHGYIHQATGAGKTVLFALLAKLFGVRVLVLVPRRNMLAQTKKEFTDMLDFPEEDIGLISGEDDEQGRLITIATYQSHISRMKRRSDYKESINGVEFIVCDEGHKALGDKTQDAIHAVKDGEDDEVEEETGDAEELEAEGEFMADPDKYLADVAFLLGVTATPKLVAKSLEEYFGPCISRVPIKDLVEAGFIKKYKVVQAEGRLAVGEATLTMPEELETEIIDREQVYEKLLTAYGETARYEAPYPLRTAVFCPSIKACEKFLELAQTMGFSGMIVTSGIGKDDLAEAEKALESGEINFIITVDRLTEGWNFPALNSVIWARACNSPARIVQAAGRASRYYENEPYAYFFETNWNTSRRPKVTAKEDDPDGAGNSHPKKRGEEKSEASISLQGAFTLASAFYALEEDPDVICEGNEGSLEFTKIVMLDENGMAKIRIRQEDGKIREIEVVGSGGKTAESYATTPSTFHKRLADLKPVEGFKGRSGSSIVDLYVKFEVDVLFPPRQVLVPDERGIAMVEIEKDSGERETFEVVASGKAAANTYGTTPGTLITQLQLLEPLSGFEARSGTKFAPVYPKLEVDRLFIQVDDKGIGTVALDKEGGGLEEVEVVIADPRRMAAAYGVSDSTFRNRCKTLETLPKCFARIGLKYLPVYRKSDVDRLFKIVVKLDANGCASIDGMEVIGIVESSARVYGISTSTLKAALSELTAIDETEHVGYVSGPFVPLYLKSEVDALLKKRVILDAKGCGTLKVTKEDGEEEIVEVVGSGANTAKAHGISQWRLTEKLKGLQALPDCKGKAGSANVDLYRKDEVDSLFTCKYVRLDDNGVGQISIPSSSGEKSDEITVIGLGNRAAKNYGIKSSAYAAALKTLTPIEGYKGKSGASTVAVYRKAEVDRLFITLDAQGFATIDLTAEGGTVQKVEAVGAAPCVAKTYGVSYPTFHERLALLSPISGFRGRSGNNFYPLYKKSDLDEIMPKPVELDENGFGFVDGVAVASSLEKTGQYYGLKSTTYHLLVRALNPIAGFRGRTQTRFVSLYRKEDVERAIAARP